jgi:ribosomal small subunit protein bTHX
MGKGDSRTETGKRSRGSYGTSRKKKSGKAAAKQPVRKSAPRGR